MQKIPVLLLPAPNPGLEATRSELQTNLFQSGKADLIDRDRMESALSEVSLGKSGLIDSKTAPQLGKMTGAKKLVSLTDDEKRLHIVLTDIETLRVEYDGSGLSSEKNRIFGELVQVVGH